MDATSRASPEASEAPLSADNPLLSPPLGFLSVHGFSLSLNATASAAAQSTVHFETSTTESTHAAPPEIPVLQEADDDKLIFRVVYLDEMAPKDGLNSAIRGLTARWEPWSGTHVDERFFDPEAKPLSVQCLGRTKFILFTAKGPVAAETAEHPTQFYTLTTNPEGPVYAAAAKPASSVAMIRTTVKRTSFIQVSAVVEVFEVADDMTTVPTIRTLGDRVQRHRFFPMFHPLEDAALLLYQSPKRHELVRLDLGSGNMRCVCRLPKPSSLRFYQAADTKGAEAEPLSELVFATNRDGGLLLRYNVSMHVMSIYDWDEIKEEGRKRSCNFTMIREPLPVEWTHTRAASIRAAEMEALIRPPSGSCVWFLIESLSLNRLAAEQSNCRIDALQAADRILHHTCETILRGHGATLIQRLNERGIGAWGAAFNAPLDAVRCGLRLIRACLDAPWPPEVLAVPEFSAQLLPYRVATPFERKCPVPDDPMRTKYGRRGPPVRVLIAGGYVSEGIESSKHLGGVEKVITPDVDGLVAVDGPVLKLVKPLMEFTAGAPPAQAHIGRVGIIVPYELDARLVHWLK